MNVTEKVQVLQKRFKEERPSDWKNIPDIELYMDQVISYMPRQHIGLADDETLTSAMINNYIKKELLPRAKGKKYNREHLAYLTAICLFKQVLSVTDTDSVLKLQLETQTIEAFYEKYCRTLDSSLTYTGEQLDSAMEGHKDLNDLILELAVSSYTHKLLCERLLAIMSEKA